MPRRGLSAGDGVEGLPRGGKQRAQIFTGNIRYAAGLVAESVPDGIGLG
ncbi:MAG: hypothetical protein OSB19_06495 [Opitutaceae bacterium]|nr:hypothetical protein [Opitutaceae bacterium]